MLVEKIKVVALEHVSGQVGPSLTVTTTQRLIQVKSTKEYLVDVGIAVSVLKPSCWWGSCWWP